MSTLELLTDSKVSSHRKVPHVVFKLVDMTQEDVTHGI